MVVSSIVRVGLAGRECHRDSETPPAEAKIPACEERASCMAQAMDQ
jgi:hypothetical protein